MPFGLKNTPQRFQRKMDEVFIDCKYFTCVYIDDILVFSKNKEEHTQHLKQVFNLFSKYGIVISKKKMELYTKFIKFLGVEIGNGEVKLQPHIATKILEFPDELPTLKKLRQFLGLANYGRNFVKDLGKLLGPLYSKATPHGERKFNEEDKKIVRKVKEIFSKLPVLKLPLDTDYMITETDGCAE